MAEKTFVLDLLSQFFGGSKEILSYVRHLDMTETKGHSTMIHTDIPIKEKLKNISLTFLVFISGIRLTEVTVKTNMTAGEALV